MKNIIVSICLLLALLMSISVKAEDKVADTKVAETKQVDKKQIIISPEMKAAMAKNERRQIGENQNVVDGLSNTQRFVKFLHSGFVHIIPKGIDHILFVLGLFLSTVMFTKLVWQVTTFTIAHSISLGLAAAGVIQVSADIVEPLIALSIAFVAFENIRTQEANSSRLVMIALFGLLHGLGFAFVLAEFGLPSNAFLMSLFSFNIGVELGQLTVLAVAGLLLYSWSKKPSYRMCVQIPGSILIGVVGFYWTVERLLNI